MSKKRYSLLLLGPAGSFSDYAARSRRIAGKKRFVASFAKIFASVRGKKLGLVPVRNKIIGEIPGIAGFFKKRKFSILRRFKIPVRFVLAARGKIPLGEISFVYASPVVRDQCKKFLKKYLPHAHCVSAGDSSSSSFTKIVQLSAKKANQSAAIGSEFCAKKYKFQVLKRGIQDDPCDWTEFVVFMSHTTRFR